jgi:hypothetical protein
MTTPRLIPLQSLRINLKAFHAVVDFCNAEEAAGCRVPVLTHTDVAFILHFGRRPFWWST